MPRRNAVHDDGIARIRVKLLLIWPLLRLSGPACAIRDILAARVWGTASAVLNYSCTIKQADLVRYLALTWSPSRIKQGWQELQKKGVITVEGDEVTFNPDGAPHLDSRLVDRLDRIAVDQVVFSPSNRMVASRRAETSHEANPLAKKGNPLAKKASQLAFAPGKDAREGEDGLDVPSSSSSHDEGDEYDHESAVDLPRIVLVRLSTELVRVLAKTQGGSEAAMHAELAAIYRLETTAMLDGVSRLLAAARGVPGFKLKKSLRDAVVWASCAPEENLPPVDPLALLKVVERERLAREHQKLLDASTEI